MRKSSNVTKEANGFAFFALIDTDNVIELNDPCHCFVPISEVADPSTLEVFTEVRTADESEILEEISEEALVEKPLCEIFEFKDIDICGNYDGLILAASVDAKTGIIFFQKENQPSFRERSLVIDEDCHCYDVADEDYSYYPARIRGKREYSFNPWNEPEEKKGWKKPCRNNRKTMPESKVQRSNRGLLAQVKTRCIEDDNFYDVATLLSQQLIEFALSSEPFEDEEFEFSA